MNIPSKAYEAATDAILEDHTADEPHMFAAASIKAAAPLIAAHTLREVAIVQREKASKIPFDSPPFRLMRNVLLDVADDLDARADAMGTR